MSEAGWVDRYFTSADGLRLYYRDYAPAEPGRVPVLCLPGLTRNSRDFEAIAPRIQRTRRVLCADLRGRGLSQHDPEWRNYHPGTYVGDIARLLAESGVPRVIILGTSLGGILAMLVAATAPQLLAGAILNDVGPEVAPEGLKRISTYVGKSAPVTNWAEAAAQAKATYGLAWPDATDDDWMRFARRSYTEVDGEISDVLSVETFERMGREKPDLVRVTVAGRGHPPMLDEPESLDAIDSFLSRLP